MTRLPSAPVTLLTGFLGAGKTTALNRLLAGDHGERLAVVVNEFGDAGVDAELVVGGEEEIVELSNGCLCCTVRGDLVRTLRDLGARRARRWRPLRFDRVVIEASGLASPGPAVQTLLLDEPLREAFFVDGVVCCAAAPVIVDQLERHPEAREQLGYADLVLLTHLDRAQGDGDALRAAVAAAAPAARVIDCDHGAGVEALLEGLEPDPEELLARVQRWSHEHHEHEAPGVHHTEGVQAVSLTSAGPLERDALEIWLRFLGQRRGQSLLRVKGLVSIDGGARSLIVHGVHQWLELEPGPPRAGSLLVVLGLGLDEAELVRGWVAAGGDAAPTGPG